MRLPKLLVVALAAGLLAVTAAAAAELTWLTDLPKAQQQAKKEQKLLLMNFTGSDWCPFCKDLSREVFATPEFSNYARTNLVLMEVDFPRKKRNEQLQKVNEELAAKYKADGFPTVIVLNGDGRELWRMKGYTMRKPKEWVGKLDELKKTK